MKQVTVSKNDLLAALVKNRETHRATFLEAIEGWKKRVVEELDAAIQDAKAGRKYKTSFHLPQPSDHTEDYDAVIEMTKMSVEPNITLDQREFRQFVLDEWGWKGDFVETTSMYSGR